MAIMGRYNMAHDLKFRMCLYCVSYSKGSLLFSIFYIFGSCFLCYVIPFFSAIPVICCAIIFLNQTVLFSYQINKLIIYIYFCYF